MSLIPIPQEVVRETNTRVLKQLSGKTHNAKILTKTHNKMSQYLENSENAKFHEIDSLVDDMHRSILILQKQKIQLRSRKLNCSKKI